MISVLIPTYDYHLFYLADNTHQQAITAGIGFGIDPYLLNHYIQQKKKLRA